MASHDRSASLHCLLSEWSERLSRGRTLASTDWLSNICKVQGKKAMEIKVADVAELVDARDLKSPGATEITHLSDLTRAGNPHETGWRSCRIVQHAASTAALENVGRRLL